MIVQLKVKLDDFKWERQVKKRRDWWSWEEVSSGEQTRWWWCVPYFPLCLAFLHCAFSNVSSNRLHKRLHNHIGYICLTFLCHLSLSLESDCLYFYLNQDFDPFLALCWLLQFLFTTDRLRGHMLAFDWYDRN